MSACLLHDLLRNAAQRYPDKEAVILSGKSITYKELEKNSNELAMALSRLGVGMGQRVGLVLNKSIEAIISVFGILKAGACYVPIDPRTPPSRMVYITNNCDIACLITTSQSLTNILAHPGRAPSLKKVVLTDVDQKTLSELSRQIEVISWEEIVHEISGNYKSVHMADVNPAYILYTSGSTGLPKGVAISHLNALTFINMAADFFQITAEDRLGNFAPLYFDLSIFDLFVAVKCGATIVLVPELFGTFPMKLAESIVENRISIWNSVSSVLTMLADRGKLERLRFDSLRLIHFSGDILPVKYLRILKKNFPHAEFYNIYGQTEANSSMYYHVKEIPAHDTWKIPIGRPFPNFEVFALDEENRRVESPGREGELYVKSSTVALGYWGDLERTEKTFVQDPLASYLPHRVYKTGDLVQLDEDGNYIFLGRKDHMIKSRGYRIDLNEIEMAITGYPSIRQAAAIAMPDEIIGNRIIAYISPMAGEKVDEKEVMKHCVRHLPHYMVPERIIARGNLPATSTGKIDRKLLLMESAEISI